MFVCGERPCVGLWRAVGVTVDEGGFDMSRVFCQPSLPLSVYAGPTRLIYGGNDI